MVFNNWEYERSDIAARQARQYARRNGIGGFASLIFGGVIVLHGITSPVERNYAATLECLVGGLTAGAGIGAMSKARRAYKLSKSLGYEQ